MPRALRDDNTDRRSEDLDDLVEERAFLRGRRVEVDVMGPWDYWSLMPLPIEEARARLGLAIGSRRA